LSAGYRGLRLLTAASAMIVVAVGATLATKAPCLLVEHIEEEYYSITPITPFPILPALMVVVGVLTFASAVRGQRLLSPPTAVCLGLFITSLTFWVPAGESAWRIDRYGSPAGWLAWSTGLPGMKPHIMGVIALPFLVDLTFWTVVAGVIAFDVRWVVRSRREPKGADRSIDRSVHSHFSQVTRITVKTALLYPDSRCSSFFRSVVGWLRK